MKAVTQTEIQIESQAKLWMVGNSVARQELTIEQVGDYIPGSVMVQDLSILTNIYMNQAGCDYLKHSREELQAMGSEYFSKFFPSDEIAVILTSLQKFIERGDFNAVHSFYQRVRPDAFSDYDWYLTSSKLYRPNEVADARKVVQISIKADTITYAGRKLDTLVEDDAFVRKHYQRFATLSVREKEIIRLIVEGKSSHDIADQLFLSIHTINNHRKNILHKLDIRCLSELLKFAYSFGII